MSGDQLDKLIDKGIKGLLEPQEQALMAQELGFYRKTALKLESLMRGYVKDWEAMQRGV